MTEFLSKIGYNSINRFIYLHICILYRKPNCKYSINIRISI